MPPRSFQQVNVFSEGPLDGNPVAVVLDGEELSDRQMQALAHWTNLSETTFLLPPTDPSADYRVRIFTLARELPFAGHPTLGSCHAWLTTGGTPKQEGTIVQECGAGLVPLRRRGDRLAFAAPPLIRSGTVDDADLDRAVKILGLTREDVVDAAWVDNGPGWMGLLLADADAVLNLDPDLAGDHDQVDLGVVGPYPPGGDCDFEVRAFFDDGSGTLHEDPVTGSLNASLAQWLFATGRAAGAYTASQGTRLGRAGRAYLDVDDDGTVWVGGDTQTVIHGSVAL